MSEHSEPEERTEEPTDRRMQQLRKDGSVHTSTEISQLLPLVIGFVSLGFIWQLLFTHMRQVLIKSFQMISDSEPLTVATLHSGFVGLVYRLAPTIIMLVMIIALCATLAVMVQTKWNIKEKLIHFKFDQLNPITGVKRVFSINGLVNTLKAIVKLILIIPVSYFALKSFAPQMVMMVHLTVPEILAFTGAAMMSLFWKVMYILIPIAIFDFFWSKHQWLKQNRMTKHEVKDERKSVEGDESTRRKIQFKGLQRIMQRIMKSVPQADVVITNPTHYAVALRYDRERMAAPTVLAKGQGFLALRIKEIAKDCGVPVLERKALARALYQSVEVGTEIPSGLFKAVAEVLAYVYRLKNPYKYWQAEAS
jgi:flagellar biosynthesis protein FlhB